MFASVCLGPNPPGLSRPNALGSKARYFATLCVLFPRLSKMDLHQLGRKKKPQEKKGNEEKVNYGIKPSVCEVLARIPERKFELWSSFQIENVKCFFIPCVQYVHLFLPRRPFRFSQLEAK